MDNILRILLYSDTQGIVFRIAALDNQLSVIQELLNVFYFFYAVHTRFRTTNSAVIAIRCATFASNLQVKILGTVDIAGCIPSENVIVTSNDELNELNGCN